MGKKWKAVQISSKHLYEFAEADAPVIEDVLDTYYFDASEVTHLCELQPSYFLSYLSTDVVCVEGVSEGRRDWLQMAYGMEPTEDCYMHCSDVDRLAQVDFPSVLGDEDDTEEAVREYWQGNSPF